MTVAVRAVAVVVAVVPAALRGGVGVGVVVRAAAVLGGGGGGRRRRGFSGHLEGRVRVCGARRGGQIGRAHV